MLKSLHVLLLTSGIFLVAATVLTTTTLGASALDRYVMTVASSGLSSRMYGIAYEPNSSYILITGTSTDNIKKVTLDTWYVTTFAGSTFGYSGLVDGVGTSARFDYPWGMVWDASRTAFMIADTLNQNIRKMTSGASVTTYAGSTPGSYFRSFGYVNGTTTTARFNNPRSIAVFGSTLVVADHYNNAIRSISSSGYVSTLSSSVTFPSAITASSTYVYASSAHYTIVRIDTAGHTTTIAGSEWGYTNGYGMSAQFGYVEGMTLLSDGSILVSSVTNDVIRHINTSSYYVSTYVGTGTQSDTSGYGTDRLQQPRGLQYLSTTSGDYLFVCTFGKLRTIGDTPASGATTAGGPWSSPPTPGFIPGTSVAGSIGIVVSLSLLFVICCIIIIVVVIRCVRKKPPPPESPQAPYPEHDSDSVEMQPQPNFDVESIEPPPDKDAAPCPE